MALINLTLAFFIILSSKCNFILAGLPSDSCFAVDKTCEFGEDNLIGEIIDHWLFLYFYAFFGDYKKEICHVLDLENI